MTVKPQRRLGRDATWQIAAGMQDIHDEGLVGPVHVDQKMLSCLCISQVLPIHQNRTTSAVDPAFGNGLATINQFCFVLIYLARAKSVDGPSGDIYQAVLSSAGKAKGSVYASERASAKARRTASVPLPSAKSPFKV